MKKNSKEGKWLEDLYQPTLYTQRRIDISKNHAKNQFKIYLYSACVIITFCISVYFIKSFFFSADLSAGNKVTINESQPKSDLNILEPANENINNDGQIQSIELPINSTEPNTSPTKTPIPGITPKASATTNALALQSTLKAPLGSATPQVGAPALTVPQASAAPTQVATTMLYNFEGTTHNWTGRLLATGPSTSTDWKSSGSYSLKGDVDLVPLKIYYMERIYEDDFTGKNYLRATVRSAGGNIGEGTSVKLFISAGNSFTWYDSGSVLVGASGVTLSIKLSVVKDVNFIRSIGVQFVGGAGSSGRSSLYVDNVNLQ